MYYGQNTFFCDLSIGFVTWLKGIRHRKCSMIKDLREYGDGVDQNYCRNVHTAKIAC